MATAFDELQFNLWFGAFLATVYVVLMLKQKRKMSQTGEWIAARTVLHYHFRRCVVRVWAEARELAHRFDPQTTCNVYYSFHLTLLGTFLFMFLCARFASILASVSPYQY